MSSFAKVVELCAKHGYISQLKPGFGIGPIGVLLRNNLQNEWFRNVVINNKNVSVFASDSTLEETFNFAKNLCQEQPPFGVYQTINVENEVMADDCKDVKFENCFRSDRILKTWMFVAPENSMQFFHEWQRQRRMWWTKFSSKPSRYFLTDIKHITGVTHTVQIRSKYAWGEQLTETITLNPIENPLKDVKLKPIKSKSIQPHCLLSETNESILFLNTLADAYGYTRFKDQQRKLLRLHRKLTPYQISFAISANSNSAIVQELQELAQYLSKLLRMNNISCLFLPTSYNHTLDAQWKQYDELGVPYSALLNENTLKNGVLFLRSRETTLKEEVHVADLVEYIEKLYKNY